MSHHTPIKNHEEVTDYINSVEEGRLINQVVISKLADISVPRAKKLLQTLSNQNMVKRSGRRAVYGFKKKRDLKADEVLDASRYRP